MVYVPKQLYRTLPLRWLAVALAFGLCIAGWADANSLSVARAPLKLAENADQNSGDDLLQPAALLRHTLPNDGLRLEQRLRCIVKLRHLQSRTTVRVTDAPDVLGHLAAPTVSNRSPRVFQYDSRVFYCVWLT